MSAGTASLLGLLMLPLVPAVGVAEQVRFHEFPNGLGLYHVKVDEAKNFRLSVTVWVGSVAEDPKKNAGVSHLLEHILFHQPGMPEKEFKAEIESRGGTYNGLTSNDYTHYYVTLPASHLDRGQQWLHKLLFHDRLLTDRLEQEKGIINRENDWAPPSWWDRLQSFLDPEYLRLPGLWAYHFGLPEYDRSAAGTYEVASRLTAAQVDAYYRAYYYPENMVLLYVGPHELPFGRARPGSMRTPRPSTSWRNLAGQSGPPCSLNQVKVGLTRVRLLFSSRFGIAAHPPLPD